MDCRFGFKNFEKFSKIFFLFQIFDCKYSKMLNSSNQIINFIQSMPNKFEEIFNVMEEEQKQAGALTVKLIFLFKTI